MSDERPVMPGDVPVSRRSLLGGAGLVGLGLAAGATASVVARDTLRSSNAVSFFGDHQAGIATPQPDHFALVAFDVVPGASGRSLHRTLNSMSQAAARMTAGALIGATGDPYVPPVDSGEAVDLPPSKLTITVGYGPSLFDRQLNGLANRAPGKLSHLPPFVGDELEAAQGNGDVLIQVCSDDPQVNFHAVHSLARVSEGVLSMRYYHVGFGRTSATGADQTTARNLLGFKDGTNNLRVNSAAEFRDHVWIDPFYEPSWMRGGTYLVFRKIRTHVESWSSLSLDTQEAVIGRAKASGAPLGSAHELDPPQLGLLDSSRNHVIPDTAHIRVASPHANGGRKILRRGFSFAEGLDGTTGELQCGLHFVCFQRDPLSQFGSIQQSLSLNDALSNYVTHVASAVAACPGGLRPGQGWGDQLFLA